MTAGRRIPDQTPVLEAAWRDAIDAAREAWPSLPLFIGGKSMGGRIASHVASQGGAGDARRARLLRLSAASARQAGAAPRRAPAGHRRADAVHPGSEGHVRHRRRDSRARCPRCSARRCTRSRAAIIRSRCRAARRSRSRARRRDRHGGGMDSTTIERMIRRGADVRLCITTMRHRVAAPTPRRRQRRGDRRRILGGIPTATGGQRRLQSGELQIASPAAHRGRIVTNRAGR